ncbi:MAG: response regulator [Phycisphaerae bacterium]
MHARFGLHGKALVFSALLLLASVGILATALIFQHYGDSLRCVTNHASIYTRMVAHAAEPAVRLGNRQRLEELARAAGDEQTVQEVRLIDPAGNPLATFLRDDSPEPVRTSPLGPIEPLTASQTVRMEGAGGRLRVIAPIRNQAATGRRMGGLVDPSRHRPQGATVGYAAITFSLARLNAAMAQSIVVGAAIAFAVVVLGVGATMLLVRQFLRPVDDLVQTASAIADGDLAKRAREGAIGEIGTLARAFNRMAESLRDHTENLEAQVAERTAALAESEARTSAIVQSAGDGIITIDEKGTVESFNPAAEKLFGRSADEVVGQSVSVLMPPPYRDAQAHDIQAFLATGIRKLIGTSTEVTALHRDGSAIILDLTAAELRTNGRRLLTVVVRDISERKKAEQALRTAKEVAECANRSKSEFLANISHEIRTPMNGILGMTELVLDTDLNKEQREFLETVTRSANALLDLLNDILDLSKIEAGCLELEPQDMDLVATIEGVVETLHYAAAEKGLKLICSVDPSIPQTITGDPIRIRQVLLNLVGNAVKFTWRGEVAIHACLSEATATAATLLVEVTDTGIGIPAERLDAIFSRFTQVDGATTRQYGGTGLGLAITRQIVDLWGGTLSVESQPEQGSTFRFTLPLPKTDIDAVSPVPQAVTRAPRAKDATAADTAATDGAPPGKVPCGPGALIGRGAARPEQADPAKAGPPARVLLVENNEVNRRVMTAMLERTGCDVRSADNGRLALEELERGRFDLVLMDVQMPEMDGLATTRRIRTDPRFTALPIIAVTAHAVNDDRCRCLKAGMNDYIAKPVDPAKLNAVLAAWARPRAGRPPGDADAQAVAPVCDNSGAAQPTTTEPTTNTTPEPRRPIDIERALINLAGDRRLLADVVGTFLDYFPSAFGELTTAVAGADVGQVLNTAHSLRGAAANIAAGPIQETAERLEQLAQQNRLNTADDLLAALQDHVDRLRDFSDTLSQG